MESNNGRYWTRILVLFAAGLAGVLSAIPIIPKLIAASGEEPPLPMALIQAASVVQSSAILFGMVLLGAWLSPKVDLGTPLIDTYVLRTARAPDTRRILVSSIAGGLVGGVLLVAISRYWLPALPTEFIENAGKFDPPFYTRILYGGITEEILIRWGLMTFLTWGLFRLTQGKDSTVSASNYLLAILLSAIVFGAGHLPAAHLLAPEVTAPLVAYIIVGNSAFGLIAGYLYWKRGLEAAILAHVLAHCVMVVSEMLAS